MIKLSQSTIDGHPLMSQLKTPPTHATVVFKRYACVPPGVLLPDDFGATITNNTISAIYAYGTLDSSGAFIPSTAVKSILALVDLTGYVNELPSQDGIMVDGVTFAEKAAAAANLMEAGKAPTPGNPSVALIVPAKVNDFREADLDAVIGYYNDSLKGDVVATPASSEFARAQTG